MNPRSLDHCSEVLFFICASSISRAHANHHSESTARSEILQAHSLSSPDLLVPPLVRSGMRVSAMSSISVPMSRLWSGPLSGDDTCVPAAWVTHSAWYRWRRTLWPVTDLRISKGAEVDGGGTARGRCGDAARVLGAEQNPWRHPGRRRIVSTGRAAHGAGSQIVSVRLSAARSAFYPRFSQDNSGWEKLGSP